VRWDRDRFTHRFQKEISGCGLSGIINRRGELIDGEFIISSICHQRDRGNGLGAGYTAYGIYPDFKDFYALHIMYESATSANETEDFLGEFLLIKHQEPMPIRRVAAIKDHPIVKRYFVKPYERMEDRQSHGMESMEDDDIIVKIVMHINFELPGAFVMSSGKNMGAFKGVGFPDEVAEFFRVDDYKAYLWTAHNRFPTNTPGWWGGAHPFTLLDWSIVHNGEISSYGINKRYLEMFGYRLSLMTDTEVIAYLLDLMIRKHKLPHRIACMALAAPFWKDIDMLPEDEREALTHMRMVYGSGLLNGPFAFLFGYSRGLIGLNDRIKLRPLVCGTRGDLTIMASEESAIREIVPDLDKVWAPRAGDPVIAEIDPDVEV
jgi:glutamate synthase domain-containing protein 1